MRRAVVLALAVALASCSRATQPDDERERGATSAAGATSPGGEPTAAGSCEAQAAEVGRALAPFAAADGAGGQVLSVSVPLLARGDARPIDDALLVLELDGATLVSRGHVIAAAEVAAHLRALASYWREDRARLRPDPGPADAIYLAIAPTTPWREVERVLGASAAAGFRSVRLVVERGAAQATPALPPSRVDDRVAALGRDCQPDPRDELRCDASSRAAGFATLLEEVASPCPELMAAFGAFPTGDPAGRQARLVAAIEPALVACQCKAEPAAVGAVLAAMLRDGRPLGYLPVALAAPGAKPSLALAADLPWSEAVARVLAVSGPISVGAR